jgi:4-alpha-glucanotransferase
MPWALMDLALSSRAKLAILPMQDILELGQGHRMNTPGTLDPSNWCWRFRWEQLNPQKCQRLAQDVQRHGRIPAATNQML